MSDTTLVTTTETFGNALKRFRRMGYVYGPDWRGLVVCKDQTELELVVGEAKSMFEASSVDAAFNHINCQFITERGSILSFTRREDWRDKVRGVSFNQFIFLEAARDRDVVFAKAQLGRRPDVVKDGDETVHVVSLWGI